MSGVWTRKTAVETIFERTPLGPRLLFHPRSGRREGGDARFVVTRMCWERPEAESGHRGRCRPEVMRVNVDDRATLGALRRNNWATATPYPIETWHRPWPGRIRRFLTGRC